MDKSTALTPDQRAKVLVESQRAERLSLRVHQEQIAEQIREAVAAERERWVLRGACDPTARPAREPDSLGAVHCLLSGTPETLATALKLLGGKVEGLVGGYVPLPSDQFAAVRAGERERCALIAENWQEMPGVQDGMFGGDDALGCMAAASEGLKCTAPDGIAEAIRKG